MRCRLGPTGLAGGVLIAAMSLALAAPAFATEPPTVTRVTPSVGPAAGGTSVTITGTGFTGATAVKFGEKNATSFEVEEVLGGEPYITAVAPPETGTVDVTVTTPSGTSATSEADLFHYAKPPVIEGEGASHITQSDATIETTINTEGAAPGPQSGVWYQFQLVSSPGEYHAEFTCPEPFDPSQCNVGALSAGSLPLRFLPRASGGQAVSLDLAGAGRTLSPGTTYHFRVIAANRVFSVDTNAWEPPIVYGPDVMFTTATAPLSTVKRVEPNHGPAAGETSVTITGSNFTGVTAVRFGSNNATSYTVGSETSITAVSPAGTGTVNVTVTTSSGGTSPTTEADRFTYGPTVAKVEPNHGSPRGRSTVAITGTGFTGAAAVKFGPSSAKSFTVNSATSITAVCPKGKGTVDVTVTTPAGTSPTSAADQFTYRRK